MQQWLTGHKLKNRPYEILQEIGQGGFGITYKAKNLSLDVPVVIKTPNSRLQRDKNYSKYLQSFKKEAKQLAKLGRNPHPHIVRVFDFFAEDNLPCIIMDYVPGNSLYDLVQMNGVLSEEKALEYIRQIGSALEVCHKQGIIHRDVHPNNILIHAESGKAVLIDFGISGTTQSSRNTRSGNQAFAPWEQLISFGKQTSKTPQVDIYTLAASFYYLLTGDTPTPSLARKFNNDDLIEPKQLNSRVSDRINQAILKGLELQPSDRPQLLAEWLELLQFNNEKNIKSTSLRNKEWFGTKTVGYPDSDYDYFNANWNGLIFMLNYGKLFSFPTGDNNEFEIHVVEGVDCKVLDEKIAIAIQNKKYEQSNIIAVVEQNYEFVLFDDLFSLSEACKSYEMKMVIWFDEKLGFEERLAALNQSTLNIMSSDRILNNFKKSQFDISEPKPAKSADVVSSITEQELLENIRKRDKAFGKAGLFSFAIYFLLELSLWNKFLLLTDDIYALLWWLTSMLGIIWIFFTSLWIPSNPQKYLKFFNVKKYNKSKVRLIILTLISLTSILILGGVGYRIIFLSLPYITYLLFCFPYHLANLFTDINMSNPLYTREKYHCIIGKIFLLFISFFGLFIGGIVTLSNR